MSFPTIPDVSPTININRDNTIDLLLASIAFEELGLAHLINVEAEKVQSVLGTLEGQTINDPSPDDLKRINKTVEKVLRDIIKKEMLLQFKLEDVIRIAQQEPPCGCRLLTTFAGEFDFVFGTIVNQANPFVGNYAVLFADVCGDCQNPANSSLAYIVVNTDFSNIFYSFVADPTTIKVHCQGSNSITVTGSGTATDENGNTAAANFILTAADAATDAFRIVIDAAGTAFDQDSGGVLLTSPLAGDITICTCPCEIASDGPQAGSAKAADIKTQLQERIAKAKK